MWVIKMQHESKIEPATIDDLVGLLEAMKVEIPAKRDISEAEIRTRLEGKIHGIFKITAGDATEAISVWYESECSGYIWLGYSKTRGRGNGTRLVWSMLQDIRRKFDRAFTKTGDENVAAQTILRKLGFKVYHSESNVLFLERSLPDIGRLINPYDLAIY